MYMIYQILPDETLEDIALKFNTDLITLTKLNSSNIDNIIPGMSIIVPKTDSNFIQYIVAPGDTIYSIARKNDINPDSLLAINGLNKYDYIYPNQQLLIPKNNMNIYVTKENDTIYSIAKLLDIEPELLLKQNDQLYLIPDQLVVYKKKKSF